MKFLRTLITLHLLFFGLAVCGCTVDHPATPVPTPPTAAPTSAPLPRPAAPNCHDPVASYQPDGAMPKPLQMPSGSYMKEIQDRGRLIAGVSADTHLLGSRNPLSGEIEGFDIDMVKSIAAAIFNDPNAYELRVITAADRIAALQNGRVDIVARAMTINCDRWNQIAFSTEYYHAGQKVLVRRGSTAKSIKDLGGQRVCAAKGTSSMDNLRKLAPKAIPVGADNHTGCLTLFQQSEVDAITGDDTVLAGLAAQDPYAVVLKGKALTNEPYGLGIAADHPDFVRFVNQRLEQIRTNGDWTTSYNRWLSTDLGTAPAPPKPVYGRKP